MVSDGDLDIIGTGIFETEGSAFKFPAGQDTNIDTLSVGNDRAWAFGSSRQKTPIATAANNLEIKKNRHSGNCSPCKTSCLDRCTKVNMDRIKVGNRVAMAFGPVSAANHIKIVTNQQ
ncbi:MAG: hypothetical protein NTU95_01355 [Methanothrix sp.]|nr:hypothetical protein [Methanothrix sp.]